MKNSLKSFRIIDAVSMAASITSKPTKIEYLDNIGYQLNFTGSPVGNFQIQISADYDQDINGNIINPGNWIPLVFPAPISGTDISTSYGSPYFLDLVQLSAPWVRLVYNRTSGTGTLNAYICAKSLA